MPILKMRQYGVQKKPSGYMSKITAVAIDMRNTVEGTPFVLESQQQVSAILRLKSTN